MSNTPKEERKFKNEKVHRCKYRGMTRKGVWLYGFLVCARRVVDGKWLWHILQEPAATSTGLKLTFDTSKGAVFNVVAAQTIGVCTDFQDINGNDIYEGDVIRGRKYGCKGICNWVVERDEHFCNFVRRLQGRTNDWRDYTYISDILKPRVIGNIHDDPRLLDGDDYDEE